MNLLSHHACAGHMPAAVRLGSVLPDLLPLHRRELRVLPLAQAWERSGPLAPPMAGVVAGVRFHLFVDSRFHREPLFLDLAARLRAALRAASDTPGLKRFFPAHLLAEMFLDHLLLQRDSSQLDPFYGLFDAEGLALAESFAGRHPWADGPALRRFMVGFLGERFLDDYRSLEGVFHRVGRMLLRCRHRAVEPVEVEAVARVLHDGARSVAEQLLRFIATMRAAEQPSGGEPSDATSPSDSCRVRPVGRMPLPTALSL